MIAAVLHGPHDLRIEQRPESAREVPAGAILSPDRAVGHRTWEDFLAERLIVSETLGQGVT